MNAHPTIEVSIQHGEDVELKGFLECPEDARGLIVFVRGSCSSRFSASHNHLASLLRTQGFATLLMDFLTACEDQLDPIARELRFDIPMLAERVTATLDWLVQRQDVGQLPVGLFGASTGTAAALTAAASQPARVKAIVSRDGRPDLAGNALLSVRAPTLLMVGRDDTEILRLNRSVINQMLVKPELLVLESANHLSGGPETLEQVARHAGEFFKKNLCGERSAIRPRVAGKG